MVYTDEQNKYMNVLYELSEHNSKRASDMFHAEFGVSVSYTTILNRWRESEFQLKPRGWPKGGMADERFIELHQKHNGNLLAMMDEIGYTREGLTYRLRKLGLEWNNPRKTRDASFLPNPDSMGSGRRR